MGSTAVPSRIAARAALAALCLGAAVAAWTPAHAQARMAYVRVRVTDPDGSGVEGAQVALYPSRVSGTSDASGEVLLQVAATGWQVAETSRLGYDTYKFPLQLLPSDTTHAQAVLSRAPVALEQVVTTARTHQRFGPLDGFYERRRNAAGTFITREQIEQRHAANVVDLVRMAVGLRITNVGAGQHEVNSGRVMTMSRCKMAVFMDGVLWHGASLDVLSPEDLEGVEVYNGSVPAEFAGPDTRCGAVVLWSRRNSQQVSEPSEL